MSCLKYVSLKDISLKDVSLKYVVVPKFNAGNFQRVNIFSFKWVLTNQSYNHDALHTYLPQGALVSTNELQWHTVISIFCSVFVYLTKCDEQ